MNKEDGYSDYLGDGAYVRFDGYQIILSTTRESVIHWIALEPRVYDALTNYVARLVALDDPQIEAFANG